MSYVYCLYPLRSTEMVLEQAKPAVVTGGVVLSACEYPARESGHLRPYFAPSWVEAGAFLEKNPQYACDRIPELSPPPMPHSATRTWVVVQRQQIGGVDRYNMPQTVEFGSEVTGTSITTEGEDTLVCRNDGDVVAMFPKGHWCRVVEKSVYESAQAASRRAALPANGNPAS